MTRVLLTGGAGFIGSHIVDHLIAQGHDVTVIDDLSGGFERNVNSQAEFVKGSINDVKLVDRIVKGKDIVFHLAAYAAEGLSHFIKKFNYENNLIGSVNLINAAVRENIEKFLFTSSMAVYGTNQTPFSEDINPNPEDSYGVAKYATEKELKISHELFGLKYVIIRPHNVYGERQNIGDHYRNVIGIFMNRIMKGLPPLIYGDGNQTRAFSYIDDVARAIAKAPFIKKAEGEIINVGAAKPYSINELAESVLKVSDSNIKPLYTPPRYEVKHAYCTIDKSVRLLDYKDTVTLDEGIGRMWNWARRIGPMPPTRIWVNLEIEKNLPPFWQTLKESGELGVDVVSVKPIERKKKK